MNSLRQKWMLYCAGHWVRMTHSPDTPTQRLLQLLMYDVVHDHVDKIVFGEPTGPHEVEIREKRTLAEQVAAGVMTADEKKEIEQLLREGEEMMSNLPPTLKESDPFLSSPVKEMPVWYHSKDKWRQGSLLEPRLLHVLIESLVFNRKEGIVVNEDNSPKHRVFYNLGIEDNHCYSVTITRTEAI